MDKGKKGNTAEIIYEMAKPLAEELGLRIWDVAFLKEGADWFLRIFIDKDEGVGIDDCVDMTHAIDPVLDREDPIAKEYILEVSSPGINRKLRKPEHFNQFIGAPVQVKLIRPLDDGRRLIDGILLESSPDGGFSVQIDAETSITFEKKECASVQLMEEDFN